MATRKEERERLRQIRREAEEREAREQRRRLVIGYAAAGILAAAVIIGIGIVVLSSSGGGASGAAHINAVTGSTYGVPPDDRTGTPPPPLKETNLKVAAKKAGCQLMLHLKDEGHTHVNTTVHYGTVPPSSGNHAPTPQSDGAYREMPAPEDFVHSLEHGRMEIEYSPTLPQNVQLALKGLYDTEYSAALFFPNNDMQPYAVAAVTWTNILRCKTYKGAITLDAIRDFGRLTWGRYGGEPVDGFGPLTGPTPANPS